MKANTGNQVEAHKPTTELGSLIPIQLSRPGTIPVAEAQKERELDAKCIQEVNTVRKPHGLADLYIYEPQSKPALSSTGEVSLEAAATALTGFFATLGSMVPGGGITLAAVGVSTEVSKRERQARNKEIKQAKKQMSQCLAKHL